MPPTGLGTAPAHVDSSWRVWARFNHATECTWQLRLASDTRSAALCSKSFGTCPSGGNTRAPLAARFSRTWRKSLCLSMHAVVISTPSSVWRTIACSLAQLAHLLINACISFLNHERSPFLNTAVSTKLPLNSRRVVRQSQSMEDAPRWSRIRPLVAKAILRRDASGMVRGAHFPDFDGAAGNKTRRNSDLPTHTPANSCAVPCACAAHVNHEALSVIHRGNWPTDSLTHSGV